MTEIEAEQGREPAFELRSKQGFFCQGILVVGYSLQPINLEAEASQQLTGSAVSV